jgi:hypothetical protein
MNAIQRPSGPGQSARRVFRALLPAALATAIALPAQAPAGQQPSESVELARETLGRWTETQRLISKEKQDWRLGRESLLASTAAVERSVASLRERIASLQGSISDADATRAGLAEEHEQLGVVGEALARRIDALERRALALLPRLPEPLAENVKPLSQRLPTTAEEAAASKLSLSERYMNVIGVLNAIAKWNREVTVATEVRTMTDGTQVQVAVIYIGLGQAYYAGGEGKDGKPTVGGIGTSTATGWTWKPANELAADIAKVISIYKNEQLATLVRLPVQIL